MINNNRNEGKMDKNQAIKKAAELAYEEDADQVVGFIQGEGWAIAHTEDLGRQAQMERDTWFYVGSSGVIE